LPVLDSLPSTSLAAAPEPTAEPPSASKRSPRRVWLKRLLNGWLAFHLAAILLYPASIPVPRAGLLHQICERFFIRYLQGLGMTGGHRFFAPEPGAALLIQYQVTRPDGSVVRDIFPKREIRPRLLYHRHFMLSERSARVGNEEDWYAMYARHLAIWYGAERIAMQRVVHRLPSPQDVMEGKPLDAPEFIIVEPIGEWTREELGVQL
jgi:hypothetical protein